MAGGVDRGGVVGRDPGPLPPQGAAQLLQEILRLHRLGPVGAAASVKLALNQLIVAETAAIEARIKDWRFDRIIPPGCKECNGGRGQ